MSAIMHYICDICGVDKSSQEDICEVGIYVAPFGRCNMVNYSPGYSLSPDWTKKFLLCKNCAKDLGLNATAMIEEQPSDKASGVFARLFGGRT